MSPVIQKYALIILRLAVAAAAGYFIVLFLYVSLARITFPFTFDLVEGAVLIQIRHLLAGQNMYALPRAEYTALVYPPLYFYISALSSTIFGPGFWPLRLVSILATCGCMLVIFLTVKRVTRSAFYGLVSAGLFGATYAATLAYFDVARSDTLYVFFLLVGIYLMSRAGTVSSILAGVFFSLAFFTKQTALFVVVPLSVLYFFFERKQTLISLLTFAGLAGLGLARLQAGSDGWYGYYIFTLPANHQVAINLQNIAEHFTAILSPLLLALGIGFGAALLRVREFFREKELAFFSIASVVALSGSVVSGLSYGSSYNSFIPGHAVLAILFGIGLSQLQGRIDLLAAQNLRSALGSGLLVIAILQFAVLNYKPGTFIPGEDDRKQANDLFQYVADIPGDVLIPASSYLVIPVQKPLYYDEIPLWELNGRVGTQVMPEWNAIKDELRALAQARQSITVLLDEPRTTWRGLACVKAGTAFRPQSRFVPVFYKMRCS